MFPQPTQDTTATVQTAVEQLFLPSFAQESLWFIDQLDPDSALYNAYLALRMVGELDVHALQRSLQSIVDRHEILRTSFIPVNGRPRQAIAPTLEIPWVLVDLSGLPPDSREADFERQITASNRRAFNLRTGPLIRATLYRLTSTEHVLAVDLHHSISDRWSAGIFWREISSFYHAYVTNEPVDLPALQLQYADYAAWQQQRLQGSFLEEQLRYWRDQLADAPPTLEMPTDYPRSSYAASKGAQYSFSLPVDLSQALRTMAQHEGVTLFMLLLAAFQTLLMRYSGQDDIVVGTPVAGRTRVELESLIGLFLNTLTLRTDLSGDPTFHDLLQRVRTVCLGAYEHQELPFEKLIEEINPDRVPGYSPLFQTYFVLQNTPKEQLRLDGLELQVLDLESSETKFDLVLGLWDSGTRLSGDIEYRSDLFAEATITQFIRHFQTLLEGIVAHPHQRLSRLPLLTDEETAHLLQLWQSPHLAASSATSFTHLFEAQVARTPDAEALFWRSERLTFAELDRRANQMGHYLQKLGITSEMHVGVCMDRTPAMMMTLLGVLKAGGVYLPIDPTCPVERLNYILSDATVPIVITQSRSQAMYTESASRVICIEDVSGAIAQEPTTPVQRLSHPDMVAYVIYTSGSTGNPKGVMVTHRALMDRVPGVAAQYQLRPGDRILQFVAMSFDVSLEEIFTPWLSGAAVVLLPEEGVPSLSEVTRLAGEYQLTALDLPPSYWHEWVAELVRTKTPPPPSLRLMILGSEATSPGTLAMWEQVSGGKVKWCNVYGLTETTLIAMAYGPENTNGWDRYTSIPIGHPLANTQIFVLDEHMQPQPIGVPGELYIGGPSLARGYLHRPDLTAERFVPNPFPGNDGERLYRTGDLARTLHDGNLEFLGRLDTQVKIRGYRIEPGEIETLLRQYPGVREAVVLALSDKGVEHGGNQATHLVGYVVTAQANAGLAKRLKRYLEARLPPYMVPASLVTLQQLPRTPGGKIDRKALASLGAQRIVPAEREVVYQSLIEERVAGVWSAVLQTGPIARDDDFFRLGGHSLQATQLVARLRDEFGVEVPVRVMYDAPTVAALSSYIAARRLEEVQPKSLAPIPPAALTGDAPVSFAQQRLWFLDQMEPDSPLYNIPSALYINGDLDVAALERSLDALVQRHAALRTVFRLVDGKPIQHIHPTLVVPLSLVQLSHLPEAEREAAAQQYLNGAANQPFDLVRGPLIRTTLLQLSRNEHIFLLTLHHTIADGWSLGIYFQELSSLYRAYHTGQAATLAELPISYVDYAVWQREWLQGATLAEQLAFWQRQLAGAPPILELPTDHLRPAQISYRGAHVAFSLSTDLSRRLQALAQREGVTLFMLMLAAFQILLFRYSGQEDFVVGTPVAGRRRHETEGIIGLFVNTLAVRADLHGDPTFREVLRRVREVCVGAYEHEDLPFEKLVDALQVDRTLSYAPLFQVVFALQHADKNEIAWPDLTLAVLDQDSGTSKFDLSLTMTETDEALLGWLEYSTDLFQADTINRLVHYWEHLLEGIVSAPNEIVNRVSLLPAAEERLLLADWTATERPYPAESTVQALFEAQVAVSQDAIALVIGDASFTYGALNRRANQIAHALMAAGIGPERAVGLCAERSFDLIASMLGIIKAGGFYVPLDPTYPQERLAYLMADARVAAMVVQPHLLANLPQTAVPVINLDRDAALAAQPTNDPQVSLTAQHLVYVNYTSGSTGVPKGVSIPHQAVARLVRGNYFAKIDAKEVFLQLAPVSFDAATLEIWGPLLNGGRLVMMPPAVPSLEDIAVTLRRYHVTTLWLTAGLFHLMVDEQLAGLRGVQQLLAGGDVLSPPHVRRVLECYPGITVINGYGPTENTTFTCCYPMTAPDQVGATVSIGKPIANTRVYILDPLMQPVPIGVPGELYIGGAGLARGYLHRPDLTAERFVPNPFSTAHGERLYRTGDLVRYLPDGNIEFLGRLDLQVKLHGYRIELGEIETVLGQHPTVGGCVVVARDDGLGLRLVAYVTPAADAQLVTSDLSHALKEQLPEYMVPTAIMVLDTFPLNANGKVDRTQLPAPESTSSAVDMPYTSPSTETESILANIWAQVLRLDHVSTAANFFELGGDSILSMQVIARARQAGVYITHKQLFQYQTVAELAAVATFAPADEAAQGPVSGAVPLTPIQYWWFDQNLAAPQHYTQAMLLQGPADLDDHLAEQAVRHLLHHHDALRLRFTRTQGGWQQRILAPDEPAPATYARIDLSTLPPDEQSTAITAHSTALQASLDIENGPLVRVIAYQLGMQLPSRILFIVHHLAIDAISWRVLLDDFALLYQQLQRHETPQLPAKTTSYKQWAEGLVAYAQSSALEKEAPYWQSQVPQQIPPLPVDHAAPPEANTEGAAQSIIVTLDEGETRELLQEVPKAYRTQINDALLTAVATAFREWTGSPHLYIDLEGHGREPILERVDLSRTVGWFTAIYPIKLDLMDLTGVGTTLPAIKEQLRQIPQHGIGHGILRHLRHDPQLSQVAPPEVTFNYLGQFAADSAGTGLFSPARESMGDEISPRNRRAHLLEILGSVTAGQLRFMWVYCPQVHDQATIEQLAQRFIQELRAIIAHCTSPEAGGATPSDFPLAQLDARSLSKYAALLDEEDEA